MKHVTLDKNPNGSQKAAVEWDEQFDLLLCSVFVVCGGDMKCMQEFEVFSELRQH